MSENISITIKTSNAAFDDGPATEIARILRGLADRLERDGIPPNTLFDANGNRCGAITINRSN